MRFIQLNIFQRLSSTLLILAISSVANISHSAEVLGSAIIHKSSGKCLQPFGGSSNPGNGTDVVVHEDGCNNKENKVLFHLTGDGHIMHSYSKKCLQPKNGASYPNNGTHLSLNDNNCTGDWKFKHTSSGSLKHIKSGKCIHPYGGSSKPSNNTPLVLWNECDVPRLSYTISPDNLFGSPLVHISSGKCLQPFGGSSNPGNGTDVVVHEDGCNNKENKVLFHLTGDGHIMHSYSKKCLQPKNGASYPNNGTHLSLNDNNCTGDWKFKHTSSGSLKHIKSGKCIHPYGGSSKPSNNTPLVLWDECFGGRIAFSVDGNDPTIIGDYENHLYDVKGKNDWHFVDISRIDDKRLKWKNRAGVSWTLTVTDDKSKLDVGSDCPYYSQGYTTANLQWDNGTVKSIMGPGNEPYDRN